MASVLGRTSFSCRLCVRSNVPTRRTPKAAWSSRADTAPAQGPNEPSPPERETPVQQDAPPSPRPEPGPMSRRLEEATKEALLGGGASGRRAVEAAGSSDELKTRLLDKIADANFKSQYAGSLAVAGIPTVAGDGTRQLAAAQPWSGSESTQDTVLRMLHDANKPLKPGARGRYQPPPVDMRLRRDPPRSPSQRAVSARDQAAMYTGMGIKGSKGLSDEERDELKREFRERFQPGARSMPISASGLAALANERIENAIAKGQFKDLPRGKGMERDPRADNPFDTTEYIMNRMIQRQDIVPPWIEKQQELVKAARVFRPRLRNDWKRHAARVIASRGGSLQEQMRRADEYAAAERMHNPSPRDAEQMSVPTTGTDHVAEAQPRQQPRGPLKAEEAELGPEVRGDGPPPFRDAAWEQTESAYMKLSIEKLNIMTRSYNLMAPEVARKPYFSLQRELAACFADVAPLLASEIKERATRQSDEPAGRAGGRAPEPRAHGTPGGQGRGAGSPRGRGEGLRAARVVGRHMEADLARVR